MSETANLQNNISLGLRRKEKFTIDGDSNRVIELNTGDIGIISRYASIIPEINKWAESIEKIDFDVTSDESCIEFNNKFGEADKAMRQIINSLFDYDVCEVCIGKDGSVFDITDDGYFTYAVLIENIFSMYDKTISESTKKLQKRMKSHTAKYVPQDRKRKS